MPLKIDHQSPIPLHVQVEKLLRRLTQAAEYQRGKYLPNEVELAKQLGISRNTVRQAINRLVYEGLVTRKKGVGTRVTNNRVPTRLENWHSFTQEMTGQGISFKNYEISSILEPASKKVAQALSITEGKEVVKLCRLRGLEEGPIVFFISYFHPRIGLEISEDFSQPLYDLLEKKYHTVVMLSREELSVQSADKELAEKLRIKRGDPLLFRKRFVFDPGDRIVEYNLGWYRADRFTYSIEIRREKSDRVTK
ncbi:MAG: GntR family transcriptional regulator [Calditrichaeota bacterium]|nr:GntR family transcriptional regulator [Calditrichota bacterium]